MPPRSATAANGKATTKILATTAVNRLEVYAVGADGSVGNTTTVFFTGGPGVPDIWAVSADGSVTACRVSGLSATGTARLKAKAPQSLG